MNNTLKKRSCRQHHGAGAIGFSRCADDANDTSRLHDQVFDRLSLQGQAILGVQQPGHRLAVKRPVYLSPRPPDRWTPRRVEHAELNPGLIRRSGHHAIKRVYFAHKMSLAEPTDRRVARHLPDGVEPVSQKERGGAIPRGGRGRFTACVTTADHDHIPAPCHMIPASRPVSRETVTCRCRND